MLCITHDVGETQAFERVLVIENGRIVEDAAPAVLAARSDSRYHAMLEAEEEVRRGLWEGAAWRRLWIEKGELRENQRDGRRTTPARTRHEDPNPRECRPICRGGLRRERSAERRGPRRGCGMAGSPTRWRPDILARPTRPACPTRSRALVHEYLPSWSRKLKLRKGRPRQPPSRRWMRRARPSPGVGWIRCSMICLTAIGDS